MSCDFLGSDDFNFAQVQALRGVGIEFEDESIVYRFEEDLLEEIIF
jgi:hypothetical protein